VEYLDTGSTLLNLALSSKGKGGGWARGRIVNLVGDGSSGKTLLALEACAQALYHFPKKSNIYPSVNNVDIVYNNVEGVMDFELGDMYGENFEKSIQWEHSNTCEEFGRHFHKMVQEHKKGDCLIYVVDSLDALGSEKGRERIRESIKGDKEEKGSYGTEKAKYFSSFFKEICATTSGKDITLICISQIRQNIGVMFGEKYFRCGGKSLDFHIHQGVWLRECKKLKKTFKGQDRVYGIRVHARVKRNKVAIPFREAEFNVLFNYGIDNMGSLIEHEYPKEKNKKKLIQEMENSVEEYERLQKKVEEDWHEIEKAIKPDRKKRFL